ncbi:hypothetical protein BC826DRAFT_1039619 [Russula brevipes]|nr:hypothetical protein BC826DRAFT_1039619 [Russula brevipes]
MSSFHAVTCLFTLSSLASSWAWLLPSFRQLIRRVVANRPRAWMTTASVRRLPCDRRLDTLFTFPIHSKRRTSRMDPMRTMLLPSIFSSILCRSRQTTFFFQDFSSFL